MKVIVGIFIFFIVVFIYLHVQFHLKTGEDLEIYELENTSKERLEEICDLRQPVLFDFECSHVLQMFQLSHLLKNYHAFEIKIRNVKETEEIKESTELHLPLPLKSAKILFDEDKHSQYFTERNNDFLNETGMIKTLQKYDAYLRPYMVSNCNYDILMGSNKTTTPFKYEINYRNYFLCTKGSVKIKMTPPHSTKYLQTIYDYDNFEFHSKINPWNNESDFEKVKYLEVTLNEGNTLFIPAYWWYSIEFTTNQSCVVSYKYRTYMNNIAVLPYFGLYFLQNQNVKRRAYKTVDLNSTINSNLKETSELNESKTNESNEFKETNQSPLLETSYVETNTINNVLTNTDTLDANNNVFDGTSNKLLFSEI